MRSASHWLRQAIVLMAMAGLLASGWPSVAQSAPPPRAIDHRQWEQSLAAQRWPDAAQRAAPAAATITLPPWVWNWQTETVDTSLTSMTVFRTDLDMDSAGRPHVVYSSMGVHYAYYDGAVWHSQQVGGGWFSSFALDAADHPHISYCTLDNYSCGALYYVYFDGTAWHTELVDNTVRAGMTSSLAVDALGRPHLSYYDATNQDLKYAYRDGSGWHRQTVDSPNDVGAYNSIALDAAGRPHISYCRWVSSCTQLKYARFDGAAWQIQIVDVNDAPGAYSSLQIDTLGRAHIAYCGSGDYSLRYARWTGTAWQIENVSGACDGAALKLDSAQRPAIAFSTLWYATSPRDGVWYAQQLVNGVLTSLRLSAVELDAAGRPFLAYTQGTSLLVTHMQSDANAWARLAFASYRDNNWEVYTSSADGALQSRRTYQPEADSTPHFNRGADRLVFVSNRHGNNEIYTMNIDGSNVQRLTYTPANEYWPTWSPDNTRIAFYSYRDGNAEIYVMNADGSGQTRLTANTNWDGHPAWSPDSAQLVFVTERTGASDLWLMNANGANQHALTTGHNASYPAWSPDGTRVAFNDDFNNDGWLDVALINANGTGLAYPLGAAPTLYDQLAPAWLPDGQYLTFATIQWTYYQGSYYWVDAYIDAFLPYSAPRYRLTTSGLDWWPTWGSTDFYPPTSQVKALSPFTPKTTFTLAWSGSDFGLANIKSYDIQYRDGAGGAWTDWLSDTSQTTLDFAGQYGHTYYFRSRARDYAGNLEAYPATPDTATTLYQYAVTGHTLDNRGQAVPVASVQVDPPVLRTVPARHDGQYELYLAFSDTYTLSVTRAHYGVLPPQFNVTLPVSDTVPPLYLPPLDDQISDGHFESGTLSAWNPIGPLTPTISTAAHTGDYAALLGGIVPSDTLDAAPYLSAIEQTVIFPLTLADGTLSLLYKINAAEPLSDTLNVYLTGATDALTFTLPITATDWTHQWFDVSTWAEPTATLRIELATPDHERAIAAVIDEVTWGSSIVGSRPIYLPITRR